MNLPIHDWGSLLLWHLGEVSLIIVVLGGAALLIGRQRPHVAHAMWMVVIVKCLLPPGTTSPCGLLPAPLAYSDTGQIESRLLPASLASVPHEMAPRTTGIPDSTVESVPGVERPACPPEPHCGTAAVLGCVLAGNNLPGLLDQRCRLFRGQHGDSLATCE